MEDLYGIQTRRQAVEENIEKAFGSGVNLNEEVEKARSGIYADTAENRKLARVGQQYGGKKQPEQPNSKTQQKKEKPILAPKDLSWEDVKKMPSKYKELNKTKDKHDEPWYDGEVNGKKISIGLSPVGEGWECYVDDKNIGEEFKSVQDAYKAAISATTAKKDDIKSDDWKTMIKDGRINKENPIIKKYWDSVIVDDPNDSDGINFNRDNPIFKMKEKLERFNYGTEEYSAACDLNREINERYIKERKNKQSEVKLTDEQVEAMEYPLKKIDSLGYEMGDDDEYEDRPTGPSDKEVLQEMLSRDDFDFITDLISKYGDKVVIEGLKRYTETVKPSFAKKIVNAYKNKK